jgi:hypothetical protein
MVLPILKVLSGWTLIDGIEPNQLMFGTIYE